MPRTSHSRHAPASRSLDDVEPGLYASTLGMAWPPTPDELARLRETLAWVVERSPYYRRVFAEHGIATGDLRTYDDVRSRVPRLAKVDLVENQRAHPPFGDLLTCERREFASVHTSPGPIYIPRLESEKGG